LKRIVSGAFARVNAEVEIPSTILFIAFDAIENSSNMSFADCDLCPEFIRWQQLGMKDIVTDFRPLLNFNSGDPDLRAYQIDLSECEEKTVLNEIYQRLEDGCLIAIKSNKVSNCLENQELAKMMHLHHPCIASPIGFVFPAKSSSLQELKIAGLSNESCSLAEILSVRPDWWTPTAKVKAIIGISLGLRYAHSFGLIHGDLTANNIFFDSNRRVQIAYFGLIGLERREAMIKWEIDGFSDEGWTPQVDVRAFVSLLFEIVVGHPVTLFGDGNTEEIVRQQVPKVVLDIIDAIRIDRRPKCSINWIFSILKKNDFQIVDGVDSVEVSKFVQWVEQTEE
jgi:serine/threonine protein kinase